MIFCRGRGRSLRRVLEELRGLSRFLWQDATKMGLSPLERTYRPLTADILLWNVVRIVHVWHGDGPSRLIPGRIRAIVSPGLPIRKTCARQRSRV
jgi:hypothetical protein